MCFNTSQWPPYHLFSHFEASMHLQNCYLVCTLQFISSFSAEEVQVGNVNTHPDPFVQQITVLSMQQALRPHSAGLCHTFRVYKPKLITSVKNADVWERPAVSTEAMSTRIRIHLKATAIAYLTTEKDKCLYNIYNKCLNMLMIIVFDLMYKGWLYKEDFFSSSFVGVCHVRLCKLDKQCKLSPE